MTGFAPDHPGVDVRVSPNFGPRNGGAEVNIIVLHYTGMESALGAEARLCDPASEVSAHYLVHEDGRIVQMVRESDRAWHAGKSSWQGKTDINSLSIGIEIANPGHQFGYPEFAATQIEAVIKLCQGILYRHAVAPERVLAHSDVAPGRKIDPGEKFPWRRLKMAGIGHFVDPVPLQAGQVMRQGDAGRGVEELQSMLALYGYGIDITGFYDPSTVAVVAAFQRHFRPLRIDGEADLSTLGTLEELLARLPAG